MKKYCFIVWIFMAICPVFVQATTIYKWVDSNGDVHFTDKPHSGAEEMQLPQAQTYSPPKIPVTENTEESVAKSTEPFKYRKFTFAEPADQVTIRNPQGVVSVVFDVKPMLKKGNFIQVFLDGSPIGMPQASTGFTLQDITRGSHTLNADIVDSNNKVLSSTDQITIFMMPPRVGMVPHSRP